MPANCRLSLSEKLFQADKKKLGSHVDYRACFFLFAFENAQRFNSRELNAKRVSASTCLVRVWIRKTESSLLKTVMIIYCCTIQVQVAFLIYNYFDAVLFDFVIFSFVVIGCNIQAVIKA